MNFWNKFVSDLTLQSIHHQSSEINAHSIAIVWSFEYFSFDTTLGYLPVN